MSGRISTPNSVVYVEDPPKGSTKGKKRKRSTIRDESPERRVTRSHSQISIASQASHKEKRARINKIASKLAPVVEDENEADDDGDKSDASSKVESRVSFSDLAPARRKSRAEKKTNERRSSPSRSPSRSRLSSPAPDPSTMAKSKPKKKKTLVKKSSTFLEKPSNGKEKRRNNGWQRVGQQFHSQDDFEASEAYKEIR